MDLTLAAKRIVWGKMINLGQTCVAPDYVLCNSAVREKLVAKINQTTQDFFGPMEGREKNTDLCRIINDRYDIFLLQVNLCQKLLFLQQVTHNMTTDCSLNYKFNM